MLPKMRNEVGGNLLLQTKLKNEQTLTSLSDDALYDELLGTHDPGEEEEFSELLEKSASQVPSSIDCGEEMLLRLAVSDSFSSQTYDECVKKTTAETWKPGGSGERLMKSPGSGGSGLNRTQVEQKIKSRCLNLAATGIALGPRLIRMTFHDSADFNNLAFSNGTSAPAEYGRVDSCLHTALLSTGLQQSESDSLEDLAKGDPNHNRGLRNAERWVMKMASQLSLTRPDAQVLGAVVAMEAWMDGPEFGAVYGRQRGHCTKIVCAKESCWDADTPFFKQPVAEPVGGGMMCPMTNTLDPLRSLLGLSLPEMVALQGAHSVGGVIVCSGLGNVAAGPYCPSTCGTPPKDFLNNGNLDGSVFDDTPGKLDNRYYQLLMNEDYDELPSCDIARKHYPFISATKMLYFGSSSGGSGATKKTTDRTQTCKAGMPYAPEDSCQLDKCVEKCSLSDACVEAENVKGSDHVAYKAAVARCNACKYMCGTSFRGKHWSNVGPAFRTTCLNECAANVTIQTACNLSSSANPRQCIANCRNGQTSCQSNNGIPQHQGGKTFRACKGPYDQCRRACKGNGREKRACRAQCQAKHGSQRAQCDRDYDSFRKCQTQFRACHTGCSSLRTSKQANRKLCVGCRQECFAKLGKLEQSIMGAVKNLTKRPAKWCKRLSSIKTCLDPNISVSRNNGWAGCPNEMRVTSPNHGQGRHTIIQNMERWTTWRGLHKRIMVLPSDWSWLGKPESKKLFKLYGTDESAWKLNFVKAWNKISRIGWGDQLKTCKRVSCTKSSGRISCPAGSSSIDFPISSCAPALGAFTASCDLVGGYGLKAKLICGQWQGYCTSDSAAAAEARIKQEWARGGQTPQCP